MFQDRDFRENSLSSEISFNFLKILIFVNLRYFGSISNKIWIVHERPKQQKNEE